MLDCFGGADEMSALGPGVCVVMVEGRWFVVNVVCGVLGAW